MVKPLFLVVYHLMCMAPWRVQCSWLLRTDWGFLIPFFKAHTDRQMCLQSPPGGESNQHIQAEGMNFTALRCDSLAGETPGRSPSSFWVKPDFLIHCSMVAMASGRNLRLAASAGLNPMSALKWVSEQSIALFAC